MNDKHFESTYLVLDLDDLLLVLRKPIVNGVIQIKCYLWLDVYMIIVHVYFSFNFPYQH